MKEGQNILITLLKELHVKHTASFAGKLYNEHPHRQNMFGLVMMLETYGIKSTGIRTDDKNEYDISSFETPFIAYAGGEFVVVTRISQNKIHYIWNGINITTDLGEFKKSWSGIILLVETDENSSEPEYREHLRRERFVKKQKICFLLATTVAVALSYVSNKLYTAPGLTLLLILNGLGAYIGYLLNLKQLHIQSQYADKICSLLKKSNCNNILESPEAKFRGLIGWSEIGLAYFISNILLILIVPGWIIYSALINVCTLPYSFWSVWYQKFKAKQWCPLCLIVQILLWGIFAVDLSWGYIRIPAFTVKEILSVACIYLIPLFSINMLLPVFIKSRQLGLVNYTINSLKMKDEVFESLLKNKSPYDVDKSSSNILFGNPETNTLVTIYTNPHCGPCAKMHERVNSLLEKAGDKLCIQYVFTSFGKEYETSSRFLIAAYLNNDIRQVRDIYDNWFRYKKYFREEFFTEYGYDLYDENIETELQKHKEWKKKTTFNFTPNILVNGYKLDDNYNIEDLVYFLPDKTNKRII